MGIIIDILNLIFHSICFEAITAIKCTSEYDFIFLNSQSVEKLLFSTKFQLFP